MKAVLVYLAYIYVGLLHAFFVGTCLYAWCGRSLIRQNWWTPFGISVLILAFFETYWLVVFDYFGLTVFTSDAELHTAFGISASDNLVQKLTPRWFNVLFWCVSAAISVWLGRIVFYKKMV